MKKSDTETTTISLTTAGEAAAIDSPSPVDVLLSKIDKIEQSQGQLVSKVDKIHDAIYDPATGVFAKLAEHKLESETRLSDIKQDVQALAIWKQHVEKSEEQEVQLAAAKENIKDLKRSVDNLLGRRESIWAAAKWVVVAMLGGAITLFFNWVAMKFKINPQ